jgi:kynurenine formamidase/glycosyltransferase involved in cell wall biosynthesis
MCSSIIIRAYNEEEHLGRLFTGIEAQSLPPKEIILVDSGSTDKTRMIAEHFGARILTIPKQEFSFGRSLNLGCAAAQGDLIVCISAHCYPLYENWLERLVVPFADPKVAMAYGMQRGDARTRFSEHRIFQQWYPTVSQASQNTPFANNANSAFRRSVWETMPFDETLTGLEDLDWAQRLMRHGHRIAYVAEAPVAHVHEEGWRQVENRYRREAMAMRRIRPHSHFHWLDLARLLPSTVLFDLQAAHREQRLWREWTDIVRFRWHQYWGTYRGYRDRDTIDEELRRTFYYPSESHRQPAAAETGPRHEGTPIAYQNSPSQHPPPSRPARLIDLSVPLDRPLPVWPGDPSPQVRALASLEAGDTARVSALEMCVHTGTHIDAPAHFLPEGGTLSSIPLERLLGPAWVVAFTAPAIDAKVLEAAQIPMDCTRLLLRTSNSACWGTAATFNPDYVALTPDGAQWLVDRNIALVGIDYLSIERYQEPGQRTHRILLEAGVVIVEGLNLSQTPPGRYELLCLPLRLDDAEGAPARVVLREESAL